MQPYVAVILVAVFLIVDFVIVGAVMSSVIDGILGKLSSDFPAQPIRSEAQRRNFQSMSSGILNLGYCIHIAVDETHVHILPSAFLRMFRAKPSSIPWDAIELSPKGGSSRWLDLKVRGLELKLPAWILDDQVPG